MTSWSLQSTTMFMRDAHTCHEGCDTRVMRDATRVDVYDICNTHNTDHYVFMTFFYFLFSWWQTTTQMSQEWGFNSWQETRQPLSRPIMTSQDIHVTYFFFLTCTTISLSIWRQNQACSSPTYLVVGLAGLLGMTSSSATLTWENMYTEGQQWYTYGWYTSSLVPMFCCLQYEKSLAHLRLGGFMVVLLASAVYRFIM